MQYIKLAKKRSDKLAEMPTLMCNKYLNKLNLFQIPLYN